MVWSCSACTYDNRKEDAVQCEVCETPRDNPEGGGGVVIAAKQATLSKSSPVKRTATKQSTLFGGVVATAATTESKKNPSKQKAPLTTTTSTATKTAEVSKRNNDGDDRNAGKQQIVQPTKKRTATTTAISSTAFGLDLKPVNNKRIKKSDPAVAAASVQLEASVPIASNMPHKSSSSNAKNPSLPSTVASSSLSSRASRTVMDFSSLSHDDLWELTLRTAKEVFGIAKLRNLQPAAVKTALLQRQSQIVVMATGGGKSLCYQLPALVAGGTTIVVSPLIALMADQVQALQAANVAAEVLSSSNTESQNTRLLERLLGYSLTKPKSTAATTTAAAAKKQSAPTAADAECPFPHITLLYCTPEQIQTPKFQNALAVLYKENRLAGFAIDEAHCMSSWGHDFRPAYRQLGWLRQHYPTIPLTACTATATPAVLDDIATILHFDRNIHPIHKGSFDRPNIFYKVRYKDVLDHGTPGGCMMDLITFVKKQHAVAASKHEPCSGIVYVHKREDTESLACQITTACTQQGIVAAAYHGGLKDAQRAEVQTAWTNGQVQIAIATIAFGMGIDLSHVRYVVHWSMPKSVESFYQESGRAGRDGLAAFSLLYYAKGDVSKYQFLIEKQHETSNKRTDEQNRQAAERALAALDQMNQYCIRKSCRRHFLLKHFGEITSTTTTTGRQIQQQPKKEASQPDVCHKSCDYCHDPTKVTRAIEAALTINDFTFHTRPASVAASQQNNKKNQPATWNPANEGNDNFLYDKDYRVNGLQITGGRGNRDDDDDDDMDHHGNDWCDDDEACRKKRPPQAAFVKASSILDKYEAIECQQSKKNGFVHFRSKGHDDDDDHAKGQTTKTRKQIIIPDHLRQQLPDPLLHYTAKPERPVETSSDVKAEADRLRAEIAKAKEDAERLRNSLKQSMASASSKPTMPAPPPPPPISFSRPQQRKPGPPPPPPISFSKPKQRTKR